MSVLILKDMILYIENRFKSSYTFQKKACCSLKRGSVSCPGPQLVQTGLLKSTDYQSLNLKSLIQTLKLDIYTKLQSTGLPRGWQKKSPDVSLTFPLLPIQIPVTVAIYTLWRIYIFKTTY